MQRLEIQDSDSTLVTGGYGEVEIREVTGYSDSRDSRLRF